MDRGVRVAEFTYPGDPMRIDFSTAATGRELRAFGGTGARSRPGETAGPSRRTPSADGSITRNFSPSTEREPRAGNVRDVRHGLLADKGHRVVPLAGLRKWAHDVAPG